jgi:crotonobetainyl-CoA:carnitine CoA-transferase CaiB-like acyl-CoA transferase
VVGALEGVRVLEFSQIIAAPFCGMLLADMGAEVIKVEPPEGEPWRLFAQFIPLESKTFISLNRGKKSLPLDITTTEGQRIVHKLIPEIDVVIVNYRPDVPYRCGIDYETLSAINPRLIYCENTAFGRQGPDSYRPGYDIIIQAMSGLMASENKVLNGVPQVISATAVADYATGIMMAYGITAALLAREKTGKGQKVEAALLATALAVQTSAFTYIDSYDTAWQPQFMADLQAAREQGASWEELADLRLGAMPTQAVGNIYYRTYKTKDSYLAVGCLSLSLRRKLANVLQIDDPRLQDPNLDLTDSDVRARLTTLMEEVEALFETRPTAEWLKLLDAAGVPSGPVRFVQELFDDPQVLANGFVAELEHPLAGRLRMVGPTLKMSETPAEVRASSPPLGADTDAILAGLGYSTAEVDELRARGVTR